MGPIVQMYSENRVHGSRVVVGSRRTEVGDLRPINAVHPVTSLPCDKEAMRIDSQRRRRRVNEG